MEQQLKNEITLTIEELERIKKHSHDMGMAQSKGHYEPSEKTLKMYSYMQKEITQIKIDVAETKKDVGYIKELINKLSDKMSVDDEKCVQCKDKFADKDDLDGLSDKVSSEAETTLKWRNRMIISILCLAFITVAIAADKVQVIELLIRAFK